MRGEPDDDILLTYCPTLFVVGSEACDYHPGAMNHTCLFDRSHPTHNLVRFPVPFVPSAHNSESCKPMYWSKYVTSFLWTWTKRERSRLVPMPLNDTFKIDLMQLKIDEKAAQASRKPKEESIVDSHLYCQPLPFCLFLERPSAVTASVSQLRIACDSNFQNLLKKAGNDKPSKWPEERPLLSSSFKEPRLPAKPGSAMASPVPARTESPNLLDPASISLT
ncbi:hypothetical protein OSTOST_12567 [Ostertagia ostertagi]